MSHSMARYQQLKETCNDSSLNLRDSKCFSFRSCLVPSLVLLLAISVSINIVFFSRESSNSSKTSHKSEFAHLLRDLPLPFGLEGHENTTPDNEWDPVSSDTGVVALTDTYVAKMGLPPAQRYPWDVEKGIYFLHGHHNLHCLKMVRKAILEYRNKEKQTEHWLHVDHCLTVLREDILCNADDTPRYTGGHHKQSGSGEGQLRLCRDWGKLDGWAKEHSACFQTPESWFDEKPNTERYKSCPDGSEPWKDVTAI